MSVGLSERPKPGRSGAMQRKPASRTGGITLRHRYDHVGSPCMNQTGLPSPSVDVVQPQAAVLRVVRLEVVARQPVEALVRRAEDLGHALRLVAPLAAPPRSSAAPPRARTSRRPSRAMPSGCL